MPSNGTQVAMINDARGDAKRSALDPLTRHDGTCIDAAASAGLGDGPEATRSVVMLRSEFTELLQTSF